MIDPLGRKSGRVEAVDFWILRRHGVGLGDQKYSAFTNFYPCYGRQVGLPFHKERIYITGGMDDPRSIVNSADRCSARLP